MLNFQYDYCRPERVDGIIFIGFAVGRPNRRRLFEYIVPFSSLTRSTFSSHLFPKIFALLYFQSSSNVINVYEQDLLYFAPNQVIHKLL